jgi:predicted RNA-binding Zn ribbon-like protein
MTTEHSDIDFLFVGNHTCLDFINTQLVVNGQPVDLLGTFDDLVKWLRQAHLVLSDEAAPALERHSADKGRQILDEARAFRHTLREMVERIASGKPVPQTAVEAINDLLRNRRGYPRLARRKETFEQGFQVDSWDARQLLGLLAEAATDLLCTCDLSLIKKCQNPACVLFFYDTTKNHARHWCSMSLCGNRSKVAAHYRRQRTRRKGK